MSNKKRIFQLIFITIVGCGLVHSGFNTQVEAASSISPSLSIGLPHEGALKNGEVLPSTGDGYRLMQTARDRRARFGVVELVQLIKQSTFRVYLNHKGAKAAVGDLSKRTGGEFEHHASHQNGRDVDFAFYILNVKGKSISSNEMIPFDKNGFSIEPPMKYRFDVERNWALVQELAESHKVAVQWIFVAGHLENLLLEHAANAGVSAQTIARAEQMMKQPSKNSHFDHFHIRIYCPANDKPHCKDFGPRWAWYR
ncbi:MAG: penicillin-insensitive murein endopeptidase [Deltaproteobacteria bacterium]|nr:penicillin-insensitive murein endopeptidase [Deltaproteobacteria bacterium]